ncbi:MAG: hypothetical protein K2G04_04095, partial [Oscillospiraceae bacterium]|nr:hypothetical protein [Oscillospiraceae bacterium]
MTSFVKIILEASFTAGLAALAVILIRLAIKKAPKRWAYALWAVVFFRCLCPFSVESGLSVFNAVNTISARAAETESPEVLSEAAEDPETENILPVQRNLDTYGYQTAAPVDPVRNEITVPTETAVSVPLKKPVNKNAVILVVWATGALAMALYGVISYVLLMRKLRTAVKSEEGVYESDLISTAFSAGFFPPKIYVPCGLFEDERKLIIAHERVHIRRLDYIIKPVVFLALTVHWFNPLIWLSFALMTKDMELSCDEAVLKIFGAGEKKAYSEALLRVSMKRSGLADNYKFMPLAFAETGIKGRVKNVLKYKKPTVIVTILAAAVVVAACAVLGTNAKSMSDDSGENAGYTLIGKGETAVLLAGSEGDVIYDQIFKGTTNLSLDGYVPAYIACNLEEVGTTGVIGYSDSLDGATVMYTGFHDDYSFQFHNAYTNKIESVIIANYGQTDYIHILGMTTKSGANTFATSLFDMEEYGVTSLTLEDMYTETEGETLYLNIKLKFISDIAEFEEVVSNPINEKVGTYTTVIEKGENKGEYTASLKINYVNASALDSFAIILSGFDEAEKYVNPRLVLGHSSFYTQEETSPYDNAKIEKVYRSDRLETIELYDNGLFKVTDFVSSYMPTIISAKRYRFENGSLILEFNDGSVLCFDETYSTDPQAGGEASFAFNKAASHKTDSRSRDVPFYEDGKVFATDDKWLEIEKAAERERAYQSSVNYSDLEMIYSREFRSIYLFKNGDFVLHDSSREYDPNEDIGDGYSIDGETLTMNFTDGTMLCFDMVSSGNDETNPDLVKEFELSRYKLVYNKKNSRIPKKSTEDIPEIYHGEVFDIDEAFIAMKVQAGEVSDKFINNRTLSDEEIRQMEEEQEKIRKNIEEAEQKRREEEEQRKLAEEELKSSWPALQYPVSATISKGYSIGDNFHHGVDFAVPKGTEVYAAADGEVSETGSGLNGGYGNS